MCVVCDFNEVYRGVFEAHVTEPTVYADAAEVGNAAMTYTTSVAATAYANLDVPDGMGGFSPSSELEGFFHEDLRDAYANQNQLTLRYEDLWTYYEAAPIHGFFAACFDLSTGRQLTLRDLLDPNEPEAESRLRNMIVTCYENEYGDELFISGEQISDALLNGEFGQWSFDEDGWHTFFQVYEIGPRLMGTGEQVFSYGKLQGIFCDKYIAAPAQTDGKAVFSWIRPGDARFDQDYEIVGNEAGRVLALDGSAMQISVTVDVSSDRGMTHTLVLFYANCLSDAVIYLPDIEGGAYTIRWTDAAGFNSQVGGEMVGVIVGE